jgi:predicted subunit of tRNA(5-methylaminomethyl-2-thiouridylate) methyltransferase
MLDEKLVVFAVEKNKLGHEKLKLEKELLSNTGELAVRTPQRIKNQHPIKYIWAVNIEAKADENKMISAASD